MLPGLQTSARRSPVEMLVETGEEEKKNDQGPVLFIRPHIGEGEEDFSVPRLEHMLTSFDYCFDCVRWCSLFLFLDLCTLHRRLSAVAASNGEK